MRQTLKKLTLHTAGQCAALAFQTHVHCEAQPLSSPSATDTIKKLRIYFGILGRSHTSHSVCRYIFECLPCTIPTDLTLSTDFPVNYSEN